MMFTVSLLLIFGWACIGGYTLVKLQDATLDWPIVLWLLVFFGTPLLVIAVLTDLIH